MHTRLVGIVLAGLVSCIAQADSLIFLSGNELHDELQSENMTRQVTAIMYVLGVADTMQTLQTTEYPACRPKEVTRKQLGDVVKKWLEKNPDKRHFSASSVTMHALSEAFPCP